MAPKRPVALARTDKMLGVILLGNNLVNSAAATLVSVIAIGLFGEDKWVLGVGTLAVTFAILVFSEITRKSSAPPMRTGLPWSSAASSPPLRFFIRLSGSSTCLPAFSSKYCTCPETGGRSQQTVPEELRSLVLESSHLIPQKHHAILSSLFELNTITVEDVNDFRAAISKFSTSNNLWEDVKINWRPAITVACPPAGESLDQLVGIPACAPPAGQPGRP